MWPQQQQQTQTGQFNTPSYAYNNNHHLQPMQQPPLPALPQSTNTLSTDQPTIDTTLKRKSDGPVLWFAGPPLNKSSDPNTVVHSQSYLDYKRNKGRVSPSI